MDPLSLMFMAMQGNTAGAGAGAAGMIPGVGGGAGGAPGGSDLASMMSGIKAPEATKPVFSGGVSGVGLPFLQSMPNMLAPALNASMQRITSQPQLPSLGQQLMGGR